MSTPTFSRRRVALGFTLVELMIAMAVLVVGIVAVAQLVPSAIQSDFRNRYDSTALIIAQRQLEQMVAQGLKVGNPSVNAAYFFTNNYLPAGTTPNITCNLGQAPPTFTAAVNAVPPGPVTTGAPLVAGALNIDWTVPQANVPAGYWNQFASPEGYIYQTRWNVTTFYGNINGYIRPVSKRIIISTRGGPAGSPLVPTTLATLVSWRSN